MSEINNANIEIVDASLNAYQGYIEQIDACMNNQNAYGGYAGLFYNAQTAKNDISTFLRDLNFTTPVDSDTIGKLDASYNKFYQDLKKSNETNQELQTLVSKYEATDAKLSNAKKTNTYSMLMVWIIIFLFIGVALFLSIIEDKKDMNIFSKSILVLFSLVVFFYIVKNLKFYIEQNIQ